jgi:hypothetical protein
LGPAHQGFVEGEEGYAGGTTRKVNGIGNFGCPG